MSWAIMQSWHAAWCDVILVLMPPSPLADDWCKSGWFLRKLKFSYSMIGEDLFSSPLPWQEPSRNKLSPRCQASCVSAHVSRISLSTMCTCVHECLPLRAVLVPCAPQLGVLWRFCRLFQQTFSDRASWISLVLRRGISVLLTTMVLYVWWYICTILYSGLSPCRTCTFFFILTHVLILLMLHTYIHMYDVDVDVVHLGSTTCPTLWAPSRTAPRTVASSANPTTPPGERDDRDAMGMWCDVI